MFSNNLKRSVATLGVVAGLLAAAVPASAMPGSISGKEMTDAITADAHSGNDNLRGEAIDIIP